MDNFIIYDIILCAILIAAFLIGYRRGFLRTVWGISSLLIAIALTAMLRPYTAEFFENSILNAIITDNVYTAVTEQIDENVINNSQSIQDTAAAVQDAFPLPDKYAQNIAVSIKEGQQTTTEVIANSVVNIVTDIAGTIFLFLVIRIILAIVYSVLKIAFSFPVLKQTNKLGGGIVQFIIVLAIVYIVFAAAAVYGTNAFDKTYICSIFYNNNILLSIIGL